MFLKTGKLLWSTLHQKKPMLNWFIRTSVLSATCHSFPRYWKRQLLNNSFFSSITVKKYSAPLENIRKLGSWFAVRMRMNVDIGKIHSEVFRGLLSITQRRKFPSMQSTKTLVHAFVSSRLDYWNSLLFGLPKYQLDRLQKVQNAAARVILQITKFDSITPALVDLHRLPASFTVECKLLFLFVIRYTI